MTRKYGFDPAVLYRPDAAEMAAIAKPSVLAVWRHRGSGPPFVKVGAGVRYAGADLISWLESRRVEPAANGTAAQ